MAKFESNTGDLVRVTGQLINGKKSEAFAEVQFFGEQIMVTVNDHQPDTDPANVVLDAAEALQFAGALINLADKRKAAQESPKSVPEAMVEIFGRTFEEFNQVEDAFEAWQRA